DRTFGHHAARMARSLISFAVMSISAFSSVNVTNRLHAVFATTWPREHNRRVLAHEPVRIVVADEQPIFRHGLLRLLEHEERRQIVGETGNGSEVVTLIRNLRPDILLLGFSSTPQSPVKTLEEIAASGTSVRTILLTGSIDTPDVVSAVQLGAVGVI